MATLPMHGVWIFKLLVKCMGIKRMQALWYVVFARSRANSRFCGLITWGRAALSVRSVEKEENEKIYEQVD